MTLNEGEESFASVGATTQGAGSPVSHLTLTISATEGLGRSECCCGLNLGVPLTDAYFCSSAWE